MLGRIILWMFAIAGIMTFTWAALLNSPDLGELGVLLCLFPIVVGIVCKEEKKR